MAGIGKPENLIPFEPGQSGNPGGKSSEQKRREMRNAEMATRLAEAQLEARIKLLEDTLAQPGANASAILAIVDLELSSELLSLIKQAQDRGLGAPKQDVTIRREVSDFTDDELKAERLRLQREMGIRPAGEPLQ